MEVTKLLTPPQEETTTPNVVAKTTKIKALIDISVDTKKTSKKLRTIFEKGVYQKKTQLSVLARYKRRLDSIEKQEESKQKRTLFKKLSPKNALPQFKSNFFSGQSDVFNNLAQLAAFKAFLNFGKGDIFTGLGQSLLAGGLLLGPVMLGGAAKGFFGKGQKIPREYGNTYGYRKFLNTRGAQKIDLSGAQKDIRERYARRYGERAANKKFAGEAVESGARTATKGAKAAKAFGRFGAALIPGVGAAVGAADAAFRAQAGDQTGSAIAGTAAALDAAAAASAVTGIGLPLAGLLSVASFALDATNLIRDLSGISSREEEKNKLVKPQQTKIEERLKEETKKQKQQTQSTGSSLSFKGALLSYQKAIKKFEEFSNLFQSSLFQTNDMEEGGNPSSQQPSEVQTYDGPLSGDSFWPLPGGSLTSGGGMYGAERNYGGHSGQDIGGLAPGSPVVAWKTGKITVSPGLEGPDNIITIDHGGGVRSVYKHVVASGVNTGDVVYGGQQIATLLAGREAVRGRKWDTHLHFEVWRNNSHVNPGQYLGASQKIPGPVAKERAKQKHDESSARASGQPSATPQSPTPSATPQPPRARPSTREQLERSGIRYDPGSQLQSSNVDPIKRDPIASTINTPMTTSITVPFPLPPQPQQMAMGSSPQIPLNNARNNLERSIMYKAFS
jgi:murein DD-endopeptidase MepM/ murein hydrolase activator NlpD